MHNTLNLYYVTMEITFLTRKFRNGERNLHCDVVHITTVWVSSLTLDCNGVFAIMAYGYSRYKSASLYAFIAKTPLLSRVRLETQTVVMCTT